MTIDLQRLLTERLSGLDGVYLAPDIPRRKLSTVAEIHAHQLPADEPVLALYDDTLFGSAQDGFVLTAARICWKNLLEAPQQITFVDLDPDTLSAESSGVRISGGTINIAMSAALPEALCDLLRVLSQPTAPPAHTLREQLRQLALRHLGKADPVFYEPAIPLKKLHNARHSHQEFLDASEPIVVLYDDTVFGSASDGFILTPQRLCWKNIMESAKSVRWVDLDPSSVTAGKCAVHIAGATITLTSQDVLVPHAVRLLQEAADLVQQGGPLAPEPAPEAIERCRYCGMRLLHVVATCPGCGGPV